VRRNAGSTWEVTSSVGRRYADTQTVPAGRSLQAALTATLLFAACLFTARVSPPASMAPSAEFVSVIVRGTSAAADTLDQAIKAVGGKAGMRLSLIDGVVAQVPEQAVERLRQYPGILSVTPNAKVHLLGTVDGVDPNKYPGSWLRVAKNTKLIEMWQRGWTGAGVDVALIDSGVAPVEGLTTRVINGPDLSFESQAGSLTDFDTYGHGTHLAGLIAGRDSAIRPGREDEDVDKYFVGAAPGARIVSLKVAASDGASDVSQIIAAIDWVVQHRNADGLNIRVLNLSFGTDGTQDYLVDPLAYAVEVAWRRGIVVVVAAGNGGLDRQTLNDPAFDPYVIAVGADDTKGTDDPKDDVIPAWQSRGSSTRHPDLVAPGKSIVSLRDPGSFVDERNSGARLGSQPRFFKGSGSSQAAAITSGAVATLLQQRPSLTPDQVKALLMQTAVRLPNGDRVAQGAGLINLHGAREAKTETVATATQAWPRSRGTGSLQLARGSVVVEDDQLPLQGEQDIFGDAWDGFSWAANSWAGTTWSGGSWSGRTWSGDCWCGQSWSGRTWSGRTWSGSSWSGRTWSGRTWSGRTWSGAGWSAGEWASSDGPTALTTDAWSSTIWGK
jgi:serine protease AprX